VEGLKVNLNQFRQTHPTAFLFVHHDKGIYTNNEKIWFGAYLLHTPDPLEQHNVLTILLFNEQTRKTEAQQKFRLINGLSSGFILLPDSVPPGNYQLTAYTNILNSKKLPIATYTTSIKVLNVKPQIFTSKLTLLDTVAKNGLVRAVVDINGLDAKNKSPIIINYGVGPKFSKSTKVEGNKALIEIPMNELSGPRPVLSVKVQVGADVQYLSKILPESSRPNIEVKFYPEGGTLVTGLQSRVGWEAKTSHGKPVQLKGTLLKDNKPVIEISTNSYGMGSFMIQPELNSSYSVNWPPELTCQKT
jgi:hypothetical protein